MSALRDTILHWIDKRTSDMLAAPRAWGSDEAIEMQALLLLQFRALTLRPDFDHGDPGSLVDDYMEYLTRAYPKHFHRPLHQIVESDPLGSNIAAELIVSHIVPINGEPAGVLSALTATSTMSPGSYDPDDPDDPDQTAREKQVREQVV